MNEISSEQAKLITDLESYKSVMGAKRFKRTAAEMSLGLSPERALERRLMEALGNMLLEKQVAIQEITASKETTVALEAIEKLPVTPKPKAERRKGDIVIRLRPTKGVDADYFEHVPQGEIAIEIDEHWYKWFDTRAITPYDGDVQKLLSTVFDRGMNEVVSINQL